MLPNQANKNLQSLLAPVFEKWHQILPSKNWVYHAHSDDFGVQIKKILLSPEIHERKEDPIKSTLAGKKIWNGIDFFFTSQNFENVAKHLGIAIVKTQKFYFPRDHFFYISNQKIKTIPSLRVLETAISNTHSANLFLDKTAATHTKNQLFNKWSGYSETLISRTSNEKKLLKAEDFTYSYVEGGNVYQVTNAKEEKVVLVGADHLMHSLVSLELTNPSWEDLAKTVLKSPFAQLKIEIADTLDFNNLRRLAEEMYAYGLLQHQGKTGVIDQQKLLDLLIMKFMTGNPIINPVERGWFRQVAVLTNSVEPLALGSDEILKLKDIVSLYLMKKKIVQALIAKDFEVDINHLHFITQINCHLDLFLRPGPKGSIFLIDYGFTKELLEKLLEFSKEDQGHLKQYLKTAEKLDIELSPLLNKVRHELEQADLIVIPTPGHFVYESETMYQEFPMPSEGFSINFINSLTGWSAKTKATYYIAHGVQVGKELGTLLMDTFALFLERYVPHIETYFIGRDPKNLSDFSEAMDSWNRLETQSGIHCYTFELDAKDQTSES